MQKFIFIFSYDSYVREILPIVNFARAQDIQCEFYLYDLGGGEAQIQKSKTQFQDQLPAYKIIQNIDDFLQDETAQNADAIFFGFGGRPLKSALKKFYKWQSKNAARPMTITLSPGIRTPAQYDGLAARAMSDIILFNNEIDADEYRGLCGQAGVNVSNACVLGLPVLSLHENYKRTDASPQDIRTVYFIDQSTIPRERKHKAMIADKLMAYARMYPERNVYVLMKNAAGSQTAHESVQSLDHFFEQGHQPKNIHVVDGAVEQVFERADLCVSISSAVMIECLYFGIAVAAVNDFGFSRALGNGHFEHSGIAVSLEEIIAGRVPRADDTWRDVHVMPCDAGLPILLERIKARETMDAFLERRRAMKYLEKRKLQTYKYPKRLYRYIQMKCEK